MTQQRDVGHARAEIAPAYLPWPAPQRPRVVVKRDLLPAVSVLSTVALFGMAIGWLWSRLAPEQLSAVVDGGKYVPLRAESYHRFEDLVLFLLLTLAAGLVTGSAVWLLRERRGPVVLLAATGGSALAAWLATQVGLAWAQSRFAITSAPQVGDVIALAPRLESPWVIVAWPLGTALAYSLAAAWNGHPDLGRRLG
ncbi:MULTISPECIES: DUF2567 domain-containing protein [Actinokineospora]|uniref:DUF2567 domain-containing protein n=1 Tax=Actinokineospora fastidiosa TaxID=1816 RepID=A0A918GIF9_9PSEU|nr:MULTISPECIES: DUF2567 domain-containing protein [Actinokineospora]UVS80905.1 hypothetical protein Actkin_04657 [Actinokineospora sp. UTMC 2448]GGS38097.1 hypothetical protein GCM10010171_36260 [Actinokineospora fastidiosa]